MRISYSEQNEGVQALIIKYVTGQISEAVFTASLRAYRIDRDEVRHLVWMNQTAHRNSLPYRRGDIPS